MTTAPSHREDEPMNSDIPYTHKWRNPSEGKLVPEGHRGEERTWNTNVEYQILEVFGGAGVAYTQELSAKLWEIAEVHADEAVKVAVLGVLDQVDQIVVGSDRILQIPDWLLRDIATLNAEVRKRYEEQS